jgi:Ca2+-binding RTX toxin-like protein
VIDGGSGTDTVSYSAAAHGVTINLAAGTATGDGSDTLTSIENVIGSTHNDTITGSSAANVIDGGGGTDTIYGGSGADTFMFKAATALSASVTIADFSKSDGDKIDISDVISAYDPLQNAINNHVQAATSGSDTVLKVDIDGTGTAHTWQQIATITGVTGLTASDLIHDGNLIVS